MLEKRIAKATRISSILFVATLLLISTGIAPVFASTLNVCPTCTYTDIQGAINAASAGDTISVSAGTYNENINIDKQLQIIGAGSTTIITQSASGAGDSRIGVVQLNASGTSANPILLRNLRIEPDGMAGISIGRFTETTGTMVSYLTLDHVQVIGTNANPSTEQERGLYVDRTSTLEHLEINDSAFDNLTYGWYLHKDVSADTSNVRYVTVTDTTFNHNNHKGIYAEKLSDATFRNCIADQNGYDSSILPWYFAPWSAGIDINLKAGDYANLTFDRCTVTNNAINESREGVGLTVKARDDGSTYGAYPAMLTNVTITEGEYTGNERGIRIGEPGRDNASPTNVTIRNASIYNNTQHYSGADGSIYGDVISQLVASVWVDARENWWGDVNGPYDPTGTVEVLPCTGDPASESNLDGVGAGVNDEVLYCEWLNAPYIAPSPSPDPTPTPELAPESLPATGFQHGRVSNIPSQPASQAYTATAMILSIPKLDLAFPIVGVPKTENGWDVTWLGNSVGYLAGSAFPTWAGNTVITGHVWDSFNRPGVFSQIKSLKYGDQVQIHAWGLIYTYEVRESKLVTVKNMDIAFQSEEYDWLTLLTCEFYNPFTGEYLFRRAVRAVLVEVR